MNLGIYPSKFLQIFRFSPFACGASQNFVTPRPLSPTLPPTALEGRYLLPLVLPFVCGDSEVIATVVAVRQVSLERPGAPPEGNGVLEHGEQSGPLACQHSVPSEGPVQDRLELTPA